MKKIFLGTLALYAGILSAFSQTSASDSVAYKTRKLKIEEINFVTGYYHQSGNHSAVTGGIGSEKLTDFANTIDLKVSKYDSRLRKHSFDFELGIDHYSSASSDKIDPATISSASMSDTRIYPSASWTVQNEQKGNLFGLNASFSNEFDYKSVGLGTQFAKTSRDKNRDFTTRLQAYLDQWSVIYPVELRTGFTGSGREGHSGISGTSPRNSFSASFTLSQVISKNLQVLITAEPTYQKGLLATKYQRVYFTNGTERAETLPDRRFKLPLGIRANFFAGDRLIIRSFYRYYQDNWGLKAHTVELETAVKLSAFLSVSPFYRFYAQNGVDYFAPYAQHAATDTYFTSDYDLSKFTSHYLGTNVRIVPVEGVFGIRHFSSAEIRFGHYMRGDGLRANQVSLHLQFK